MISRYQGSQRCRMVGLILPRPQWGTISTKWTQWTITADYLVTSQIRDTRSSNHQYHSLTTTHREHSSPTHRLKIMEVTKEVSTEATASWVIPLTRKSQYNSINILWALFQTRGKNLTSRPLSRLTRQTMKTIMDVLSIQASGKLCTSKTTLRTRQTWRIISKKESLLKSFISQSKVKRHQNSS